MAPPLVIGPRLRGSHRDSGSRATSNAFRACDDMRQYLCPHGTIPCVRDLPPPNNQSHHDQLPQVAEEQLVPALWYLRRFSITARRGLVRESRTGRTAARLSMWHGVVVCHMSTIQAGVQAGQGAHGDECPSRNSGVGNRWWKY